MLNFLERAKLTAAAATLFVAVGSQAPAQQKGEPELTNQEIVSMEIFRDFNICAARVERAMKDYILAGGKYLDDARRLQPVKTQIWEYLDRLFQEQLDAAIADDGMIDEKEESDLQKLGTEADSYWFDSLLPLIEPELGKPSPPPDDSCQSDMDTALLKNIMTIEMAEYHLDQAFKKLGEDEFDKRTNAPALALGR